MADPDRAHARSETRAKNPYSPEFEAAWKLYGRKEEKVRAYAAWKVVARSVGGEAELLRLVVAALSWQAPDWEKDGWRYAKYFERYLKARKWEDEPRPAARAKPAKATRSDGNLDELGDWLAKGPT